MLKKLLAVGAVTAASAGVLLMASPAHAVDDVFTSGNGSILGGNQIIADLDIPVNICGNAISVLGVSGAQCSHSGAFVID
ncbi:chaplin family protein [Nocardiopsis ansamitocini]|uniref:Chaplin domain-containing protein n=1 Tax=Nocardiopsis ansamitocini TaxID=1670832 RepID=A0A9W6UGF3_9ACTN|nr:chaplin family protein [Nocardiopsis ansamitocini]GLU47356.1 hypothetical protein Nans01_17070 [Nocardiopsis ansamitocini]